MQDAINDQINAELWSAYLYLSMAMDAESKGYKGVANWFFVQWQEELDHSRIFLNYLNATGSKVLLKPLDGVQQEWSSPLRMFRDTLGHEVSVTQMIRNLVHLAVEDEDYATLSRLQWFVDEQVEEEQSAAELILGFERAGKEYDALMMLDHQLSMRTYKMAGPLRAAD